MMGLELGIAVVELHRSFGPHKADAAAVKATAVVEIGLPVTVVGNWHRTAGNFEAVKKVAVVEEDSMSVVLVAAGRVENAVSAVALRVPSVGWRLPSAATHASRPIRDK
jgi:hypothetical protein